MSLGIYYLNKHDVLAIKINPSRHDSSLSEGSVTKMLSDNNLVSMNIHNASKYFANLKPGMLHPSDELLSKINELGNTNITFDRSFVVAYVNECELVPGTHLHKLSVNDGINENLQIICGAKNIAKGQKVVLCTTDTFMPDGAYIGAGKLRGIDSYGMICSQKELNVSGFNSEGIIELPKNYVIGQEFMEVYNIG